MHDVANGSRVQLMLQPKLAYRDSNGAVFRDAGVVDSLYFTEGETFIAQPLDGQELGERVSAYEALTLFDR